MSIKQFPANTPLSLVSPTGVQGDVLNYILVIPTSLTPGAIRIKDGSLSEMVVFQGGAASVTDMKPFKIELNSRSVSGGWFVATGLGLDIIVEGDFS